MNIYMDYMFIRFNNFNDELINYFNEGFEYNSM